jgi:hypothetical protein
MPARDPFYKTRAAEIAANIILAELDLFKGTVFTELDSFCDGQVIAKTRAGNTLTLEWDVDHQCIRTVRQDLAQDQVRFLEIAA